MTGEENILDKEKERQVELISYQILDGCGRFVLIDWNNGESLKEFYFIMYSMKREQWILTRIDNSKYSNHEFFSASYNGDSVTLESFDFNYDDKTHRWSPVPSEEEKKMLWDFSVPGDLKITSWKRPEKDKSWKTIRSAVFKTK